MFLLISCSFAFEYLLCFVHGQGQRTKEIENKNIHKETGEFSNQSHSINYSNNIYLAQIGKIMFQYKAGLLPTCFENIFLLRSQIHVHNTRYANYFSLPKCKTNIRLFSFQYQGPKFFNSLSHEIQNSPNIASFKHKLKRFLLS